MWLPTVVQLSASHRIRGVSTDMTNNAVLRHVYETASIVNVTTVNSRVNRSLTCLI